MEQKIILTTTELKEELMVAWVDGWNSKHHDNDEGKREYSQDTINDLLKKR